MLDVRAFASKTLSDPIDLIFLADSWLDQTEASAETSPDFFLTPSGEIRGVSLNLQFTDAFFFFFRGRYIFILKVLLLS